MAELLGVDIRIGGMWHAGSYDPQDFLGRVIGEKPWVRNAERSMFECYDDNFFATQFHIELFQHTFRPTGNPAIDTVDPKKFVKAGWPMEYLGPTFTQYKGMEKKDIILFPHRIAPEKQPEIFYDLKDSLPQYEFIVCQEKQLSKNEYHNLLGQAKLVFSANLQETLGISWYEGVLVDTIPMVPDRLSYREMAIHEFKYPSILTKNLDHYKKHKSELMNLIVNYMDNYNSYLKYFDKQKVALKQFFHGDALYRRISNGR
tara:strand:- start:1401 stop:2177 length:777 start_codon:yes stop_codon:yes gene_type:complete